MSAGIGFAQDNRPPRLVLVTPSPKSRRLSHGKATLEIVPHVHRDRCASNGRDNDGHRAGRGKHHKRRMFSCTATARFSYTRASLLLTTAVSLRVLNSPPTEIRAWASGIVRIGVTRHHMRDKSCTIQGSNDARAPSGMACWRRPRIAMCRRGQQPGQVSRSWSTGRPWRPRVQAGHLVCVSGKYSL